ncbi:MAG: aminoacyl-histidine dipeptidase, partial [Lachnospiraceae bacterium]|nr:aminoacyl-histidine dipeptidase [Lachnospiraceae bacterium]
MRVLENQKPERVFYFFEEIAGIPHGSYHTKQISDYCMQFAKKRGLEAYQDEYNNVIIIKEATKGYEQAEPIILQGHLDMVCEKESDVNLDFEKEGLSLYVDGDFVRARGTTLGGDDGIAIAYAMALLDSDDIQHPRLECVFTSDEEVGMLGAEKIDLSVLKGHRVLNIDSDEEGCFLTSCAGGVTAECHFPTVFDEAEGCKYRLTLCGLQGGHSGGEIAKERANAIIEMGRILKYIEERLEVGICSLQGGLKDNAIPRESTCEILIVDQDREQLEEIISELDQILKKEYQTSDPAIELRAEYLGNGKSRVMGYRSQNRILFFLRNVPNGLHNMTVEHGIPETSL